MSCNFRLHQLCPETFVHLVKKSTGTVRRYDLFMSWKSRAYRS